MSWPLVIQRVVKRDIASAIRWYDRQRRGLGDEFKAELETALHRLECGPPFAAPIYQDVRFAKLTRFPYVIYFRQHSDRIEILAVLHGKRSPITWQRRTRLD